MVTGMDTSDLSPTERRKDFQRRIEDVDAHKFSAVTELRAIFASKKAGVQAPIAQDVKGARAVARALLNGLAPVSLAESLDLGREQHLIHVRDGCDLALHVLRGKEADAALEESVVLAGERTDKLRACSRNAVLAAIALDAAQSKFRELTAELVAGTPLPCTLDLGVYGESIIEALLGGRFEHVIKNSLAAGIITNTDARKARDAK